VDFRHYIFDDLGVAGDLEAEVGEELGRKLGVSVQTLANALDLRSNP